MCQTWRKLGASGRRLMACVTQKSSCACEARCGMLHAAVHVCAGMLSAGSCVRDSEKDYSACEGAL